MNHISNLDVPNILDKVVSTKPLIYHMTNMVAMEEQAHLSLAIGASPVMSLFPEEAAQMVTIANTILINIGQPMVECSPYSKTIRQTGNFGSGRLWCNKAAYKPCGRLLETGAFSLVKGNGGEISLLAGERAEVRGVDSVGSPPAAIAAKTVAQKYNCIAAATGLEDYVSDGERVYVLEAAMNGLPESQGRVAGLVRLWRLAYQ